MENSSIGAGNNSETADSARVWLFSLDGTGSTRNRYGIGPTTEKPIMYHLHKVSPTYDFVIHFDFLTAGPSPASVKRQGGQEFRSDLLSLLLPKYLLILNNP